MVHFQLWNSIHGKETFTNFDLLLGEIVLYWFDSKYQTSHAQEKENEANVKKKKTAAKKLLLWTKSNIFEMKNITIFYYTKYPLTYIYTKFCTSVLKIVKMYKNTIDQSTLNKSSVPCPPFIIILSNLSFDI